MAGTDGRIAVKQLPTDAPELNPVAWMGGNLKTRKIGDLVATPGEDPSMETLAAFYRQSTLWPE